MWQLVINGPGYFETPYDVPVGVTGLGRADENEIVLSGDLVSRRHSRFTATETTLKFEDLSSRNGSKLNGEVISGQVNISPGDTIVIGDNMILVRHTSRSETASTEAVEHASQIRRLSGEVGAKPSVLISKDMRESGIHRFLDNVSPIEKALPPLASKIRRGPSDTDDGEGEGTNPFAAATPEGTELSTDGPSGSYGGWNSLLLLYRVAEQLATATNQQSFLDITCDLLMRRVGAATAVVLLRQGDGKLQPAAVRHSEPLRRGEVPVSDAIIDFAISRGQAIACADVADDNRFSARDSVVLYKVDQVLCIPLGSEAPFSGVLYLNRPSRDGEPIEALLESCCAVAHLLLSGVQKFRDGNSGEARLRHFLERYHSQAVVDRLAPELRKTEARQLTEQTTSLFVVRIDDFAELSRTLAPPALSAVVRDFMRLASQLVLSFDGAMIRLEADLVVAAFGTPTPRSDDAVRAVRAALAFRAEWEGSVARRPAAERSTVRGAVHTGKVLAGHLGTDTRLDFVVTGENLEQAYALAAACQHGQLLISGKTLASVGARFEATPLGERQLPGLSVKLPVFEVLEEDSESGTLSGIR